MESCKHVPHHLSRRAASQNSHRYWKFVSLTHFAMIRSVDSSSLSAVPQQMGSIPISACSRQAVIQVCEILWHVLDSVTTQGEQPRLRFRNSRWRHMRKGTSLPLRAGVERARIVARHCIHPSRVRSGLRMTRTTLVDLLRLPTDDCQTEDKP